MKDRDVLELALDTFGHNHQENMLLEEMTELTTAILKFKRYRPSDGMFLGAEPDNFKDEIKRLIDNIHEEIVDVQIMLDQIRILYQLTPEEEEARRKSKISRLAAIITAGAGEDGENNENVQ